MIEMAKQVAVTAAIEAREIIRPLMHLLHEGCFGIDQPVIGEDTADLRKNLLRDQDMLQNRLHHHRVEIGVRQRDMMRVGNELDVG
jgi:hypothetical protein